MKRVFSFLVSGLWLIGNCGGGGSLGSGSPKVSLSTPTLTFGTQLLGTASEPQLLTVTNSGTAALNIGSITPGSNFGETHDCASTLAAGAGCTINVTFTPAAAGTLNGTLSLTDNATDSPQMVSLSGTGSVAGPSCSVRGQQCGAPQLPSCCAGLVCAAASTRAFCEP
jgi:hypothetical protein